MLKASNNGHTSTTSSPLKQRRRLQEEGVYTQGDTGQEVEDMEETADHEAQLNALPTYGQPVLDTTLQHDMAAFMHNTLKDLGDSVDYVENKMGDSQQTG